MAFGGSFLQKHPKQASFGKRALDAFCFPGLLSVTAPLRISCGDKAPTNVTTPKGAPLAFVPDRKYTAAGVPARVPQAEQHNLTRVEATLRVFPTDATSCYRIPVLPGRFLIRLGWASYNYDGKGDQARFGVLLQVR